MAKRGNVYLCAEHSGANVKIKLANLGNNSEEKRPETSLAGTDEQ